MSETSEIRQAVRQFVVDNFLFGQDGDLQDGTSFMDQGIIDSTGILELVAFVEKTWDVKVEDEDLVPDNMDSLDNICAFIQSKLGQ
jgi:acyl carrier protein